MIFGEFSVACSIVRDAKMAVAYEALSKWSVLEIEESGGCRVWSFSMQMVVVVAHNAAFQRAQRIARTAS